MVSEAGYKVILGCVLAVPIALLSRIFYRLFFHPLSQFPGPKFAAASGLYEFYHNVLLDGKFHLELEQLHSIYGSCLFLSRFDILMDRNVG
jgi:hypothetical protein